MTCGQTKPIRLPGYLQALLEKEVTAHLRAGGGGKVDFTQPPGKPALMDADSVSWRVFKNPVALLVGGVTAVLMEFAEPRVRSGVWDHTSFRYDPLARMRRTGFAAMVTVYGARSVAEPMIAHIRRLHDRIHGKTPAGVSYRANEPELLRWVHATAAFGFMEAYHRFVQPLTPSERDRYYAENAPVGRLYGADRVPDSEAALQEQFELMHPKLEPSEIVFEFLSLMKQTPILPLPLRPAQGMLLRAAVEIVPPPILEVLGLGPKYRLRCSEEVVLRRMGALSDRILIDSSPSVQSSVRLGLGKEYLYR